MKPVPGTAVQGLHGVCGSMSIPQLRGVGQWQQGGEDAFHSLTHCKIFVNLTGAETRWVLHGSGCGVGAVFWDQRATDGLQFLNRMGFGYLLKQIAMGMKLGPCCEVSPLYRSRG